MSTSIVAGSLLVALSVTGSLHAQQVAADVVVRSGPVAGRVILGAPHHPYAYSTYRRPVARPVVVYRPPPPRLIVIERVYVRHRWLEARWRRMGFRPIVVYYRDGRYYDRDDRRGPPMRQVVVYQHDGRLYQECDERDWRDRYDGPRHYQEDRDWHDWHDRDGQEHRDHDRGEDRHWRD
jgi:hypothetical protein